jgi:hypothetical protein
LGYKDDIRLELKFAKQIKGILGMYFIQQDVTADLKQGTDFLVFTISAIKVAARLRTYYYYLTYPNDFTIRYERPNGVKTEIDKIRQGLVDYLFYGFVDEKEDKIIKYLIGDLNIFRQYEPKPLVVKWNNPPDSSLAAWNIKQFPSQFILKQYSYPSSLHSS